MELSAFTGASHFTKILEGPRTLTTTLIGVRSTKTSKNNYIKREQSQLVETINFLLSKETK